MMEEILRRYALAMTRRDAGLPTLPEHEEIVRGFERTRELVRRLFDPEEQAYAEERRRRYYADPLYVPAEWTTAR